jgi:hypothetical protein
MTKIQLPTTLRGDRKHKQLELGLDLPEWFYSDIKSIDPKLHFVWTQWKTIYDNVMNQYYGMFDDARLTIHEEDGHEVWGYPLKNAKDDAPLSEEKWHIWRLCDPYGWCHITSVEAKDPHYLLLLAKRLYTQAVVSDKYGQKEYAKMTLKQQHEERLRKQQEADGLYNDVQNENKWLTNKAMESMLSGKVAPTRPTKDVIASYSGQGKRSKITRPITDREGGLILPDEYVTDE